MSPPHDVTVNGAHVDHHHATGEPGTRALRIGVGGPVGSGKTTLVGALCRLLRDELSIVVVTNDIFTTEDADALRAAGVLPIERIVAVETGCCPHTAIRDDIAANLDAVELLEALHRPVEITLVESGGDNLTAIFSRGLVDAQIFVLDTAGGDDVPRKGGPGVAQADLLIVNKVNTADPANVATVLGNCRRANPRARVIQCRSVIRVDRPELIRGKRALVVEDGPTLTHGGMSYGAGFVAAVAGQAAEIVDPRPKAAPALAEVYARYPHIGRILPAVGYDDAQLAALAETIRRAECDVVVSASPVDLAARMDVGKPIVRARYEYADAGEPTLGGFVDALVAKQGLVVAS
jgi:urease accessory protein